MRKKNNALTQHAANAHTKLLSEKQSLSSHVGVLSDVDYFLNLRAALFNELRRGCLNLNPMSWIVSIPHETRLVM